jgi:hypothetical protein
VPGGVLVGQLPNPHFPIESHSKLPLMGWAAAGRAGQVLEHLAIAIARGIGFHSVMVGDLRRRAVAAGFEPVVIRPFNYRRGSATVGPLDWCAWRASRCELCPGAWQFVLRRL